MTMSDEEKICEEKIISEYFKILNEGFIPKANDLKDKVRYRIEVESLDLAYGKKILDGVTSELIHNLLTVYKHVHYYEGKRFFECQNLLFAEWFSYQKILLLAQNS
jgi:hypothetical protein